MAPSHSSFVITALSLAIAAVTATPIAPFIDIVATSEHSLPECGFEPSIPPLERTKEDGTLGARLEQVQTMIRHGDRTRCYDVTCWDNDNAVYSCDLDDIQNTKVSGDLSPVGRLFRKKYMNGRNFQQGNCALGQLTKRGRQQQEKNGQALREAYVERERLLPRDVHGSENLFFLRSDDEDRTEASAEALFDGMYPYIEGQPTHMMTMNTQDKKVDPISPNDFLCPGRESLLAAFHESEEYLDVKHGQIDPLESSLSAQLGVDVAIDSMFDCIVTHACHGYDVPMSDETIRKVLDLNTRMKQMEYGFQGGKDMARVNVGPLLKEIVWAMEGVITKSQEPKRFLVYSGHDTGPIMPFLSAFGVEYSSWSPFASMVTLELYSNIDVADNPSGFGVRLLYNGEVRTMKGCPSTTCPWSVFEAIANDLMPTKELCPNL